MTTGAYSASHRRSGGATNVSNELTQHQHSRGVAPFSVAAAFCLGLALVGCSGSPSRVDAGLPTGEKPASSASQPSPSSAKGGSYTSDCATTTPPLEGAAPPDDRVCVKVSLSKVVLRQGDTAAGTVTITNKSSDRIDISHPSGCAIWYGLYRDGSFVGGGPEYCDATAVADALEPGASKSWSFAIDTNFGADLEGANLEPGSYVAAAGVNTGPFTGRNFNRIWFAPPSPPFEITG